MQDKLDTLTSFCSFRGSISVISCQSVQVDVRMCPFTPGKNGKHSQLYALKPPLVKLEELGTVYFPDINFELKDKLVSPYYKSKTDTKNIMCL